MKISRFIAPCAIFILIAASCSTQVAEKKEEDLSAKLYAEYKALAEAYADSLKNASDSSAAGRLLNAYDARLYALMMKYPPETDAQFSESQNDTLFQITRQILQYQSRAIKGRPDTIAAPSVADSLSVQLKPVKENE